MGEPLEQVYETNTILMLPVVVTLTSEKGPAGFKFGRNSYSSQCFLRAQAKGKSVVKYKD